MTQLTIPNPQDLQGQTAFDAAGDEVGPILGVYLDNATRQPEWAAVRLDATTLTLVPLEGARTGPEGLELGFDRDRIAGSPFRQSDLIREVTQEAEEQLYRYYGRHAGNGNGEAVEFADGEDGEDAGADPRGPVDDVRDEVQATVATAGEKAAEVTATAKEQVDSVVGTAKEEVSEVAAVMSAEAREMVDTTRSQLSGQASTQLQAVADGMHRLAGQALALTRGNPEMAGPVADIVSRAGFELQSVARGLATRGGSGLLDDATRVVRQRPRAVILGTAVALVAGGKLLRTPAGDQLKEKLAPLKEQAVRAGRNVAEELKPVAQQRVQQMKAVATNAADQLNQEAGGKVQQVKGEAKRAARTVKGTAQSSARTVKGTASSRPATARASTARRPVRTAAATF